MAGPAPKTKGWTARENKHKPKGLHLIVTGMVEVNATNKDPVLTEAPHVGKVLPLDLTITETGVGDQLMVWKPAYFHKVVSANQFDKVDIRWDGKTIASCPVVDDSEYGHALVEQMETVNAAHANEKGPERSSGCVSRMAAAKKAAAARAAQVKAAQAAAAKYPTLKPAAKKAAKKAATKKAAKKKKAVGGWAKGKKAKKKSAKKAKTGGSTVGRLVRRIVKKLRPAKKKKR